MLGELGVTGDPIGAGFPANLPLPGVSCAVSTEEGFLLITPGIFLPNLFTFSPAAFVSPYSVSVGSASYFLSNV